MCTRHFGRPTDRFKKMTIKTIQLTFKLVKMAKLPSNFIDKIQNLCFWHALCNTISQIKQFLKIRENE